MLKIKRIGIIAVMLIFVLSIMGCKSKVADENKIKEDIVNNGVNVADVNNYSDGIKNNMSVDEVESFKITDRKTSTDSKSDVILADITLKSSDFKITGKFKIIYNLFDDGWKLTDIHLNEEHYDFSYDGALTDDDIKDMLKKALTYKKYELKEIESIEMCNAEAHDESTPLDIANAKVKATTSNSGLNTEYEMNCKLEAKAINSNNDQFKYTCSIKNEKETDYSFSDDFSINLDTLKVDLKKPINYIVHSTTGPGVIFTEADIADISWNGDTNRVENSSVRVKNIVITLDKLTDSNVKTVSIDLDYYLQKDGTWISQIEKNRKGQQDKRVEFETVGETH